MSYWGNCPDALSLYALSDMCGIHTCVITKMKPWTTVDSDFKGTVYDVLDICQIKLAYLGENRFGRLWKKVVKDAPSHLGANFNYKPMISLPPVPNMEELEVAHTLANMQNTDLPEPFQLVAPPEFHGPDIDANSDAMDKITGHFDVSCASKLKFPDAMDQVIMTNNETLYVETSTVEGELPVIKLQASEKDKTKSFYVETPPLKECHICVTRLEMIIFEDSNAKSSKLQDNDFPSEKHFTRSRSRTRPERVSRRLRKVSKDVHYTETETSNDDKKQHVAKQSDLNPNLQLKAHPSLESIHRKPDQYIPIEGSNQCHLTVMILRIGTLTHQPHHHSPFPKENIVPDLKELNQKCAVSSKPKNTL